MHHPLIAALACLLLFSGCLGIGIEDPLGTTTVSPPARTDHVSPQMLKVRDLLKNTTCAPSAPAAATSANLKLLTSFSLPGNQYAPKPIPGQIDTFRNRTAYGALNGNFFAVVNTTDPTKPVIWDPPYTYLLPTGVPITDSRFLSPMVTVWDMQFSGDGNNVVVGVNNRLYAMDVTTRFSRLNIQGGFLDLPNDYGGQAARLAIHPIGGIDHVFVAPGPTGTGMFAARLAGSGLNAKFEPLGLVVPGGQGGRVTLQPYDTYLATEWINGGNHTLLYAANGPHGILVLDVTQPTRPDVVSTIPPPAPGPNGLPSYYVSIQIAHIEGKRLLVANQVGGQSLLKVWDITDFKAPKQLATWMLDAARPYQPQGEIAIANATLFVNHHGEGVWGLDLAPLARDPAAGLKPVLHFQPPAGGSTYDISVEDGLLQVSDATLGSLHLVGYGCFTPGDPRLRSGG